MKKIFYRPLISYVSLLFIILEIYFTVLLSHNALLAFYITIMLTPFSLHILIFGFSIFAKYIPLHTNDGLYFCTVSKSIIYYKIEYIKWNSISPLFLNFGVIGSVYIKNDTFESIYSGLKDVKDAVDSKKPKKTKKTEIPQIQGLEEFKNFDGHIK
jgi:hypothetical protein